MLIWKGLQAFRKLTRKLLSLVVRVFFGNATTFASPLSDRRCRKLVNYLINLSALISIALRRCSSRCRCSLLYLILGQKAAPHITLHFATMLSDLVGLVPSSTILDNDGGCYVLYLEFTLQGCTRKVVC